MAKKHGNVSGNYVDGIRTCLRNIPSRPTNVRGSIYSIYMGCFHDGYGIFSLGDTEVAILRAGSEFAIFDHDFWILVRFSVVCLRVYSTKYSPTNYYKLVELPM